MNLSQRFFKQKIKLYRLMTIFLKLDTINVDAIVYTIYSNLKEEFKGRNRYFRFRDDCLRREKKFLSIVQ